MTENQKFLINEIEKNGIRVSPEKWAMNFLKDANGIEKIVDNLIEFEKLHAELQCSNLTVYNLVLFYEKVLQFAKVEIAFSWAI